MAAANEAWEAQRLVGVAHGEAVKEAVKRAVNQAVKGNATKHFLAARAVSALSGVHSARTPRSSGASHSRERGSSQASHRADPQQTARQVDPPLLVCQAMPAEANRQVALPRSARQAALVQTGGTAAPAETDHSPAQPHAPPVRPAPRIVRRSSSAYTEDCVLQKYSPRTAV